MKESIIIGSLCFILAGCGERVRTIEYYEKQPDAANAVLSKCASIDIMQQLGEDANKIRNCQNAAMAHYNENVKKLNAEYGRIPNSSAKCKIETI